MIGNKALALVCGILVIAGSGTSQAALTYLDANRTTNTGPAGAIKAGVNSPADDGLWSERIGFGSSTNIFQSGDGDGEDAPELVTTITGLTPNAVYSVYAHFWDPTSTVEDWNLRAGLVSGSTLLYAAADASVDLAGSVPAVLASTLTYSTPPTVFLESSRNNLAALLGVATADGSGQINVYVDDMPSTVGVNRRSWYDGVSYELAIPEPVTAMLFALALPALHATRRRAHRV
jgi:hypothetical protein